MTRECMSKVVVWPRSQMFKGDAGQWDQYTKRGGALLEAARAAAPVRFEGEPPAVPLCTAKTIQEYLYTKGLRQQLLLAVVADVSVPLRE